MGVAGGILAPTERTDAFGLLPWRGGTRHTELRSVLPLCDAPRNPGHVRRFELGETETTHGRSRRQR